MIPTLLKVFASPTSIWQRVSVPPHCWAPLFHHWQEEEVTVVVVWHVSPGWRPTGKPKGLCAACSVYKVSHPIALGLASWTAAGPSTLLGPLPPPEIAVLQLCSARGTAMLPCWLCLDKAGRTCLQADPVLPSGTHPGGQIKELPHGKGSWLVSPRSIPPSLGCGVGDTDRLHVGSYAEISGLLAHGLPAG